MSENVNIIEKAIIFATLAHAGRARKSEPYKPQIVHPFAVAQILMENGITDPNVIAAAYLHDVTEDTKFTLEDIRKNFGEDIAHLVEVASEPDKSKPWEERKKHKIETTSGLLLTEKLVPTADKINNIEDIYRKNKKLGYKDFSAFNRGEEKQEWYFRNIYKSLITNEDKQNPLFVRLENGINNVFERTMEDYFGNEREF